MEIFCTALGHFAILLGRNQHLNPNSDFFVTSGFVFVMVMVMVMAEKVHLP
jgi:hypothetical protein